MTKHETADLAIQIATPVRRPRAVLTSAFVGPTRLSQPNENTPRGPKAESSQSSCDTWHARAASTGARGRVNRARVAASTGPVRVHQSRRATWHEEGAARANAFLWCGADRWRGFISAVRLIKLFNPTVDINSCWLYIGVGSGTLKHTEFTPKKF